MTAAIPGSPNRLLPALQLGFLTATTIAWLLPLPIMLRALVLGAAGPLGVAPAYWLSPVGLLTLWHLTLGRAQQRPAHRTRRGRLAVLCGAATGTTTAAYIVWNLWPLQPFSGGAAACLLIGACHLRYAWSGHTRRDVA